MRELIGTEFYLYIAPVCNLLGILKSLKGIGKNSPHLLFRLDVELTALIAEPVLILNLLSCLDAQKDIMAYRILGISIVDIVGCYKGYIKLPAHAEKVGIYILLFGNAVILELKEVITFTEDLKMLKGSLLSLLIHTLGKEPLDFTGKAG